MDYQGVKNLKAYGWQRLLCNLMLYNNLFLDVQKKIWDDFYQNSLPIVLGFNDTVSRICNFSIVLRWSTLLAMLIIYIYIYIYIYICVCVCVCVCALYTFTCIVDTYRHLFTTGNEEVKTVTSKKFLGALNSKFKIYFCTNWRLLALQNMTSVCIIQQFTAYLGFLKQLLVQNCTCY